VRRDEADGVQRKARIAWKPAAERKKAAAAAAV
jgi:hypothetical protein